MSWNEPGGSGDRNPWGKRGDTPPPDLDEMFRRLQRRLGGFGGRGGSNSAGPPAGMAGFALAALLAVWLAFGFYVVREGEQAVVLRFGAYHTTTGPGLHWRIPAPVDRLRRVDMGLIRSAEIGYRGDAGSGSRGTVAGESLMLTADENIVDIEFAIQYRVADARAFLFNLVDPLETVVAVTESAVREVIGKNRMEYILTEGRAEVAGAVEELVQKTLDTYGTGLQVTSVNMRDAQPPEQVQAAFFDAIQAREDEQRLISEAEAYRNDVLPRARGESARVMEEAAGYSERVVAQARGEAARFDQVLSAYREAPDVTRERLYLETIEKVLGANRKVIVDQKNGGQNLYYLPLDRLLEGGAPAGGAGPNSPARPDTAAAPPDPPLRLPREAASAGRGREPRL